MSNICYKYNVIFTHKTWIMDMIIESDKSPADMTYDMVAGEAGEIISRATWQEFDPSKEENVEVTVDYLGAEIAHPDTWEETT